MPKYLVMTLALVLACAAGLPAQNNPLSAELKRFYEGSRNNIMRAAEKVPEADYSFKPTTTVRNFGEEVAHAAEFQVIICSAAKGEQRPNPAVGKTSKTDLLAALKASSDYCDSVYDALTDATAAQTVKLFGRDFSKFGALYFNVIHNNETYGTMVPYMRLRNIVPPTSEPRDTGKKQ
jgi:uncharacterized damage-inducible protein DinB